MTAERYLRATIRLLIATGGALIARGDAPAPATGWEWAILVAGLLVAGLTAFEAFLSKYSGLNP